MAKAIQAAAPGSVIMLENTRSYDIERVLWKAKPADLPKLADQLARLANEFAAKVAKVYVNEAFSAGSLDASSMIVPAGMDRVALGEYVAEQFDGPMLRDCLAAQFVVFSGMKTDKLDDHGSHDRPRQIRLGDLRPRLAGDGAHARRPPSWTARRFRWAWPKILPTPTSRTHIPRYRIDQAKKMLTEGRAKGIEFVLPVDFVVQDGSIVTTRSVPPTSNLTSAPRATSSSPTR